MIEIAQARPPATHRAAFTLLEIMLAIALLGIISAALVSGSVHLLNHGAETPEQVFWDASAKARETALKQDHDVLLSYDDKEKTFVLDNNGSTEKFPVVPDDHLTIDFLHASTSDGRGTALIGGQLVDTETIPFVTFYADGTCTPFRVQFRTNGPADVIAVDPWTCARELTPPDNP